MTGNQPIDSGGQWSCPHCGRNEHNAILVADDEIEVDVTCQNVYLTFNDDSGDPGMAFTHSEFEKVIDHYQATGGDKLPKPGIDNCITDGCGADPDSQGYCANCLAEAFVKKANELDYSAHYPHRPSGIARTWAFRPRLRKLAFEERKKAREVLAHHAD